MVQMQNDVSFMFRNLGDQIVQIQAGLAGAARVFELLDLPEEPKRLAPLSNKDQKPAADAGAAVKIADLSFHYSGGKQVLSNLNLTVPKGKMYALVGPSGGGKSTILKLLLGFYAPTSGTIENKWAVNLRADYRRTAPVNSLRTPGKLPLLWNNC